MPAAMNHTLDAGLPNVHFTVVASAHPESPTTFTIPPSTLAASAGVHAADPCLLGTLAHRLDIHKIESPFPVGVLVGSGEHVFDEHGTHTVASTHETGSYHAVGGTGVTVFPTPISVDIAHPGNVHSNVIQMIKRGTRWRTDVGKTAADLVKGLEVHEGIAADGTKVSRVLVPLAGDHPCTRALALNANTTDGPFSQYSAKNRKTVTVGGAEHIIVERAHLDNMAATLQDNLSATTHIGKHGITFKMRPLPGVSADKHSPGKIVIHVNMHKHRAHDILAAGDAFEHPSLRPAVTSLTARAMLDGGVETGAKPTDAVEDVKLSVLSAKLAPAKHPPLITPVAPTPAPIAAESAAAGGEDDDGI